jgi:hypothetical protein
MNKMFGKVTVVAVGCILSVHVFAQGGLEVGLRYMVQTTGLLNSADKNGNDQFSKVKTWSYLNGGVSGIYSFNRHIGAEVEVLISRQGQEYSGNNMQASGNSSSYSQQISFQAMVNNQSNVTQAKAELNCLKIPLLLRLTSDNIKPMYYSLAIGPQLNLLRNAVFEMNDEDIELPQTNIEPTDVYKKTTVDGVLALGIGFNVSRHMDISAQARFDYGFQDAEKKDAVYTFNGNQFNYYNPNRPSSHNATAALMIGFSYKL